MLGIGPAEEVDVVDFAAARVTAGLVLVDPCMEAADSTFAVEVVNSVQLEQHSAPEGGMLDIRLPALL